MMESKEVIKARQEYELADERMEKIFNEALAEVERLNGVIQFGGLSKLTLENMQLREALEDAIQLARELIPYKSDYLVKKHNDKGELKRLEEAFKGGE